MDQNILSPKAKFIKQGSRNLMELDRKELNLTEIKTTTQILPSLAPIDRKKRSLSPSGRRYESLDSQESRSSSEH